MNRHVPGLWPLVRIIICASLLLFSGCVRRSPIATPYPHPSPQPDNAHYTEKPARPRPQSTSEHPLASAIRQQARQLVDQGKPEAAAQALERGLRITPKNGWLWLDLAEIRLEQGRLDQAEALARKADSLAHRDPVLREHARKIINAANQ